MCIGFTKKGDVGHKSMDTYCGFPSESKVLSDSIDRFSQGNTASVRDLADNLLDPGVQAVNGGTLFTFSRRLHTRDTNDISLVSESGVTCHFALSGSRDTNTFHNGNRGSYSCDSRLTAVPRWLRLLTVTIQIFVVRMSRVRLCKALPLVPLLFHQIQLLYRSFYVPCCFFY